MEDRFLFRGKRKDNGEWIQGCLYGIWERRYILGGMTNDIPNMVEVDPSTVCQCTGGKDKNSKLIYEDDIAKDDKGNLYKAFWQDNHYQFSWMCVKSEKLPIGAKWNFDCFRGYEMEVIGNVFDNPELLEV
nr:MAG TPA: YopX protein [Caudoviricetes sp.]